MDKKIFQYYKDLGFSVIGCNDEKIAVMSWDVFKSVTATEKQIDAFVSRGATMVGLVCGSVSGNLLCIDIDTKHHPDPEAFWEQLWGQILDYYNGDPSRLLLAKTRSGGYHLWFMSPDVCQGSKKIASRPATPEELKVKPKTKQYCFIETREEGGYAIVPPSAGYEILIGSFDNLPVMYEEEREDIFSILNSFNEIFIEEVPVKNVSSHIYKDAPWDAYNNDLNDPWMEILLEAGWQIVPNRDPNRIYFKRPGSENKFSANFHKEKRRFYVFTTSTEFESEHGYTPFSIFKILKCGGNASLATSEVRKLGYGKTWSNTEEELIKNVSIQLDRGRMFADILASFDILQGFSIEDQKKIEVAASVRNQIRKGVFWQVGKRGSISIDKNAFLEFLKTSYYDIDPKFHKNWRVVLLVEKDFSTIYRLALINEERKTIRQVVIKNIKDEVFSWVDHFDFSEYDVHPSDIKNLLLNMTDATWTAIIEGIQVSPMTDFEFLRDDREHSYHFFKNAIVTVTADNIRIRPYAEMEQNVYIWEEKISSMIYNPTELSEQIMSDCYFYMFLRRIAGVPKEFDRNYMKSLKDYHPTSFRNLQAFMSVIGYLLTNYKDPGRPYCVLFAEDTANDGEGGGTGKGLLTQCIAKFRNVAKIDGKNWSPDKNFAWQSVGLNTDVIAIEDTDTYFPFQKIYNVITEGIDIDKKYKDALHLPYEISPKIAISSNYDITDSSIHSIRRIKKVLLKRYFNRERTPQTEFDGKNFFYDWNEKDWNLFYTFGFQCIMIYLREGVISSDETENSIEKAVKLRAGKYGDEFYQFVLDLMENNGDQEFTCVKKDLWRDFLEENELTSRDVTMKAFTNWVRFFCDKYNVQFEEFREKRQEMYVEKNIIKLRFNKKYNTFTTEVNPNIFEIIEPDF